MQSRRDCRVETASSYALYDFLTDYHARDHPYASRAVVPAGQGVLAVLDGQQRLTALNIAVYGSLAVKKKYAWWSSTDAFPKKRLYLNLLADADPDELGLQYDLRFLTDQEAKAAPGEPDAWYPLTQVMMVANPGPAMFAEVAARGITDTVQAAAAYQRLYDLFEAFRTARPINYYLETDQDPDKVLDIFVRSGWPAGCIPGSGPWSSRCRRRLALCVSPRDRMQPTGDPRGCPGVCIRGVTRLIERAHQQPPACAHRRDREQRTSAACQDTIICWRRTLLTALTCSFQSRFRNVPKCDGHQALWRSRQRCKFSQHTKYGGLALGGPPSGRWPARVGVQVPCRRGVPMHVGRGRLTLAGAIGLAAVLAACSSSGSSSTSASSPTGSAAATAPSGSITSASSPTGSATAAVASGSITLAGVVANATDPYWVTVMCGGTAEAKKLGVSLKWYSSTTTSTQSMSQNFDAALLIKPQGMYINPFSAGQFSTQVKSLMGKGVPVIASAALSPASEYTDTFINTAGGQFVHKFLQQLTPGPGSLVVLGGIAGIKVIEDEYTPLLAAVKSSRPDIKILPVQYDQFDVTKATQMISSLLLSHPDLKMIIAPAGPEGQGAAAAIEQAHKVGKVKIWAYDATPAEVQALKAGVISVLLAKPAAAVGAEAVRWLVSAIKADPNHAAIKAGSGPTTALPVVEITKANVNDPAIQGDLYKGTCSS